VKLAGNDTTPSRDERAWNQNEVGSRDLLHLGLQYRTEALQEGRITKVGFGWMVGESE
jgi:hypothetical protein